MKTKQEKRSPLRDKPLRVPGQSIEDQIDSHRDTILTYILYPVVFIGYLAMNWVNSILPKSPNSVSIPPSIFWLILVGFLGYCVYKIRKAMTTIDRLKMARDGERMVAEELQVLLRDGAAIIHDIVGDKFNIDHVIISKHGVFLVETKTYSKPVKKDVQITSDENHVYVNGHKIDREPIKQVKSLSKWLNDLLFQTTGQKFPVRPVILFPGWFIEPIKKGQDVWILNPKALPKFISNEPVTLKDTDVHLITYHLSRYVRAHEVK